jgi:4-hydroxybenzoate polyprenyltransferase
MSTLGALRAVRWVGWLVTVISGFMLTLLTNGHGRLLWMFFCLGCAISLGGLILERYTKPA